MIGVLTYDLVQLFLQVVGLSVDFEAIVGKQLQECGGGDFFLQFLEGGVGGEEEGGVDKFGVVDFDVDVVGFMMPLGVDLVHFYNWHNQNNRLPFFIKNSQLQPPVVTIQFFVKWICCIVLLGRSYNTILQITLVNHHWIQLRTKNLNYKQKMAFIATTPIDDYNADVKTDHSVPKFTESISSIAWAQGNISNMFAATTWDGQLRIFSVQKLHYGPSILQKLSYKFPFPVMKCAWNDQNTGIFVGLMDGSIKSYDLGSGQIVDVGKHNAAVSSLHFINGMNAIVSTAYQANAQIWQLGNPSPVMTINAQSKIYASDFQFPTFIACTSDEKILMLDINNQSSRNLVESSDLGKGSQLQSVAINNKLTTFGVGSADGRANISSLIKNMNTAYSPKTIITFKSNKQEETGKTILYPINSVGFNPLNEKWFMTAGSDGCMHFWDYEAKNKIKTLSYTGNPVCTAKVSPKGDMVAYGLGNDWHMGKDGLGKWQVKLGVHHITQAETKYKK